MKIIAEGLSSKLTALEMEAVRTNIDFGKGVKDYLGSVSAIFNKATLDYDFTTAVYKEYKNRYVSEVPLVDAVTCARNSTGTADHPFGMVMYDVNEPRIQYNPLSGERLGLLGEEARTNLFLRSEEFDNAAWVKQAGATITPNTSKSPDGTSFADTLTTNNGVSVHQSVTTVIGSIYCQSVYIKAGTITRVMIRDDSGAGRHIVVNPVTGAITSTSGTLLGFAVDNIGSGWFRAWFSYTADSVISRMNIRSDAENNATVILWGAQFELGSTPSTYIPTTSIALARLGALQTLASLPAMAAACPEYTIYLQFTATDDRCLFGLASVTNGFNNTVYFAEKTAYIRTNNVFITSMTFGYTYGTKVKIAIRIKAGDYALAGNGAITGASNAAGAPPTDLGRATVFNAPWESTPSLIDSAIGVMERIVFIPKALTNTEMQFITK